MSSVSWPLPVRSYPTNSTRWTHSSTVRIKRTVDPLAAEPLMRWLPSVLPFAGPNRVPEMQRALQNDTRFMHQKMPRAKLYMRAL